MLEVASMPHLHVKLFAPGHVGAATRAAGGPKQGPRHSMAAAPWQSLLADSLRSTVGDTVKE